MSRTKLSWVPQSVAIGQEEHDRKNSNTVVKEVEDYLYIDLKNTQ